MGHDKESGQHHVPEVRILKALQKPWPQITELDFRERPQVQPGKEDANPADMVKVRAREAPARKDV